MALPIDASATDASTVVTVTVSAAVASETPPTESVTSSVSVWLKKRHGAGFSPTQKYATATYATVEHTWMGRKLNRILADTYGPGL